MAIWIAKSIISICEPKVTSEKFVQWFYRIYRIYLLEIILANFHTVKKNENYIKRLHGKTVHNLNFIEGSWSCLANSCQVTERWHIIERHNTRALRVQDFLVSNTEKENVIFLTLMEPIFIYLHIK